MSTDQRDVPSLNDRFNIAQSFFSKRMEENAAKKRMMKIICGNRESCFFNFVRKKQITERMDLENFQKVNQLLGSDDHFAHAGIAWKFSHSPSQFGEFTTMIQCSQCIELLQCYNQCLLWWWIQKVEMHQIVDTQTLQHQHDVAQICSLDLKRKALLMTFTEKLNSE